MSFPKITSGISQGTNDQKFFEAANKRFKTSKSAIAALRRVGKPSDSALGGFYALSDPGGDLETVLSVFTALATKLRMRPGSARQSPMDVVLDNWLKLLYPWLLHLMEDLILGGYKPDLDPITPAGLYILDKILWTIPYFCSLPDPEIGRRMIGILVISPRFGPVVARVLVNTLDRNHSTWILWAILTAQIVDYYRTNSEESERDIDVFEILKFARATFVRHFYRELPRVATMDDEELIGLNGVLFLYRVKPQGEGKEALTVGEADQKHALRVLVRLLSSLLRKRKKPRPALEMRTVMFLMESVDVTMDGNILVEEAVDAGLVVALLKAHPLYFSKYRPQMTPLFIESASRLLSEIAKFLGFPSVLHRFLRSVKVISKSQSYQERLRGNSEFMWRIWEQVITKASIFRDMRSRLKVAGNFWKCDSLSCDHSYVGKPDLKFRCCTGCSGAIYCSKSCQRVHWRAGHETDCSGMRDYRISGVPTVTATDLRFFQTMTEEFLASNRTEVNAKIEDYVNTIVGQDQLSEPKQLIANRVKNPIVVIEFFHCWSRHLLMEDCIVQAPDELYKFGSSADFEQQAREWNNAELDSNSLYVIVMMPMTKKTSTMFTMSNRNWSRS